MFLPMFTPSGYPCVPSKMFNQFVLAVWPAIANIYTHTYTNTYKYIYMSEELYYIDSDV